MCNFKHINVRGKIKTAHTPLSDQPDLFLEILVISVLCVSVCYFAQSTLMSP